MSTRSREPLVANSQGEMNAANKHLSWEEESEPQKRMQSC